MDERNPNHPCKPTIPALELELMPKCFPRIEGVCSSVQLHGDKHLLIVELVTVDGVYNRAESCLDVHGARKLLRGISQWIGQHHPTLSETMANEAAGRVPVAHLCTCGHPEAAHVKSGTCDFSDWKCTGLPGCGCQKFTPGLPLYQRRVDELLADDVINAGKVRCPNCNTSIATGGVVSGEFLEKLKSTWKPNKFFMRPAQAPVFDSTNARTAPAEGKTTEENPTKAPETNLQ